MICPLGRPPGKCKRIGDQFCTGADERCSADLDERAAHVAHHLGLAHKPLTRDAAMALAIEQAKAGFPGHQRDLV